MGLKSDQPPLGGCVLKPSQAAGVRRMWPTQPPLGGCVLKLNHNPL